MMSAPRSCVLFVLILVGASGPARAGIAYRFQTIDVPGSEFTQASGINDAGQIVGDAHDPVTGKSVGFLLSDGVYTTVDYPGSNFSSAPGINNFGTVVGGYSKGSSLPGFVLSGGSYSSFNIPGATGLVAWGINDHDQVSGTYFTADGHRAGFILSGSALITINFDAYSYAYNYGINNQGQTVGAVASAGHQSSYIHDSSGLHLFDYPSGTDSGANGINDAGDIVGFFRSVDNGGSVTTHGYVRSGGMFTALDMPGAVGETQALGINNHGVIVGRYFDGVRYRGFIATAVPEPGSLIMCLSAATCIVGYRRLSSLDNRGSAH